MATVGTNGKVRITMEFTPELYEKYSQAAEGVGITVNMWARMALAAYGRNWKVSKNPEARDDRGQVQEGPINYG